jgi:peptidoglycan L-alanyl-D-glutamate endopeptidase CwlK
MSKVSEQSVFAADIARLIQFVHEKGWAISFGEAFRPIEMQEIYVKRGLSKTMKSKHLERLACDFNFFKMVDGKTVLVIDKASLQAFGDYWESLDKKNSWGGNWKSFLDCPHFERRDV